MPEPDDVRLTMPAGPEYVRLARITASGLANRLGFGWDDMEDLRLAVDELCHAVIGPSGRQGVLNLRFRAEQGGLRVEATGHFDPGGPPLALSQLAHQILSALVDEHDVAEVDGDPVIWFRKQASGD